MWQLEYAHLLIYIECDDIFKTVLNCGMLRMHVRKVQCYVTHLLLVVKDKR